MTLHHVMDLHILGLPIGQGRITTYGKGRTTHSNAKTLLPWREHVQHVAEQTITQLDPTNFPLLGPIELHAAFTVPKPKSAPKLRITYPITRPDLSHLVRAIEDALTAAGVWKDDSQIIAEQTRKTYPDEHGLALHVPGVKLAVYAVTDLGSPP